MGRSPFATKDLFPQARSNRRRSTRIDFITPVILAGRDASGQTFHEETVTAVVNLHGARVRTAHQVMVGMIVTVQNPGTGQGGKAICVEVYEPPEGQTVHEIGIQLVQPGNIWGVENPPPDWENVAAQLGGRVPVAEPVPKTNAVGMKPAPETRVTPTGMTSGLTPEVRLADLEQRAARLMDSVLDILRIQADAAVRTSLQEFEKRLETIVMAADSQLRDRAEQAGGELESTSRRFGLRRWAKSFEKRCKVSSSVWRLSRQKPMHGANNAPTRPSQTSRPPSKTSGKKQRGVSNSDWRLCPQRPRRILRGVLTRLLLALKPPFRTSGKQRWRGSSSAWRLTPPKPRRALSNAPKRPLLISTLPCRLSAPMWVTNSLHGASKLSNLQSRLYALVWPHCFRRSWRRRRRRPRPHRRILHQKSEWTGKRNTHPGNW